MTEGGRKRQIFEVPLAHYESLFREADAREIAARTGIPYDEETGRFALRLVGASYRIDHPVFAVTYDEGASADKAEHGGKTETQTEPSPYEKILLLRYLLEGKYVPWTGAMLSYAEMPWGPVYDNQFKGRVISRIAREFGREPALLAAAVEYTPGLSFEKTGGADAAYRFEVLNGLWMAVLVWAGDDEFPASAQALFSDNFKYAYMAEDMAVIGDIVVSRLKQTLKFLRNRAGEGF